MASGGKALSVKWFHNGDYRRFGLEVSAKSPNGAYQALLTKIRGMFPDFTGILAWKDKEGDLIVFSSDLELVEAIRESEGNILRIFTVVRNEQGNTTIPAASKLNSRASSIAEEPIEETKQPSAEQQQERKDEGPKAHPGVVCDGCDTGIVGARYKCTQCFDYDLCSNCETKGLHKHHVMIRIPDPEDRSWMPYFMWSQRMASRPHGPRRGGFRRHCGGAFRNHPGFGWFGGQQGQPEEGQTEQQESQGGARPKQRKVDPSAGLQFLREVGETVAAALGHFGVDVDIDVEHDGKKEKVTPEKGSEQATPEEKQAAQGEEKKRDEASGGVAPAQRQANTDVEMDTSAKEPEVGKQQAEWTLLDRPVESSETNGQSVYPTAPLREMAELSVNEPAHKVEKALEQLLSMGFTNEDGWLTQLVKAKEGNVNAVLDVLNIRQRD